MEPYREDARCPKCLGDDVHVGWCSGYLSYGRRDRRSHHDERMHRTCRRCGYAWDELPATTVKP